MNTEHPFDHAQLHHHLRNQHTWLRLLYMLLFAALLNLAAAVMWIACAFQFLFAITTGSDNRKLRDFTHALSQFIFQALQFVSYNSDDKPFPFAPWPNGTVAMPENVERA